MIVTIQLHTVLQRQTPEGLVRQLELTLPAASTVTTVLEELAIDFPLDSLLLVVNGRLVEADQPLQDGDQVNLMPAISGGGKPPSSQGVKRFQFKMKRAAAIQESKPLLCTWLGYFREKGHVAP